MQLRRGAECFPMSTQAVRQARLLMQVCRHHTLTRLQRRQAL
jgi:hypothetical protein